ncbi:MAG: hypothetical protein HY023_08940 [Chloroflexi bacterium]|nr:hypothetical protein [Chloroflexota bacterium]
MNPMRLRVQRWIALTALLYGLMFVVWLGYEDQSVGLATALGAGGAALLVAHAVAGGWPGPLNTATLRRLVALGVAGLIAGLLTTPFTVTLMLLKVSQHSHSSPDFRLDALIGTAARTPVWAVAGLAAGLGVGLIGAAFNGPPKGN